MAWWASIVLLLGIAPSICAQVTVVSLGEVSAGAGAEVIVPVLLNPASSETKIGSITAAISFDPAIVSFLRAEKGF
ncbi:MAG TPA: cohesin domain-containing protein, partial [Terriglobia bacterium]|nr:cohesin domain-containing protein [Terriglobia bacterium]